MTRRSPTSLVGLGLGKLVHAFFVRLAVDIGMIPRGEVGLTFAGIGVRLTLDSQPLLAYGVFSAVVLMVLVATVLAPIGLRWAFSRDSRS